MHEHGWCSNPKIHGIARAEVIHESKHKAALVLGGDSPFNHVEGWDLHEAVLKLIWN